MANKTNPPANVQEAFLIYVVKQQAPVTVFLTNGVKLSGVLTFADETAITLSRDGVTQLVYKHAVATIMPADAVGIHEILEG
jgi:host factor-I protein